MRFFGRWLGGLALLGCLSLAGCAADAPSPPPPPPLPTPAPPPPLEPKADLWDAPRAVLTEAGYTVIAEDREKGVLSARVTKATETPAEQRAAITDLSRISHLDDPRVGGAARRMSAYEVTVHVRIGSPDSAEVTMAVKAEIQVTERVKQKNVAANVTHPVPSRGVLEKELLEKIRRSLES